MNEDRPSNDFSLPLPGIDFPLAPEEILENKEKHMILSLHQCSDHEKRIHILSDHLRVLSDEVVRAASLPQIRGLGGKSYLRMLLNYYKRDLELLDFECLPGDNRYFILFRRFLLELRGIPVPPLI